MDGILDEKVAIVTGSGQGIGRAIAIALAREGARVVTNSRKLGTTGGDAEVTTSEIKSIGGQAISCFADVARFDDARRLVHTAVDTFGTVDILVNNAGVAVANMIWDVTEDEWDAVVDVSLKGAFNCIRHAAPIMLKRGWGRILNASSLPGLGVWGLSHYAAAKAGVVGLTQGVASELAPFGITCNAYAPDASTSMADRLRDPLVKMVEAGAMKKERYEALLRSPAPETMTSFLVYLCTEYAAGTSGQLFFVSGGTVSIYSQSKKRKTIAKPAGQWTIDELVARVPTGLLDD